MFVLKIIVILSAILNIGFSATQCESHDEIEFICLSPECKIENKNGYIEAQTITSPKIAIKIVGYNKDSLLAEKNKKLSIISINDIRLKDWSTLSSWKHKVSIHKYSFTICKPKIVNPSIEKSYNDSNNAQISKNTDKKIVQTSDEISNNDPSIINLDYNNETGIESEDKSNINISLKQDPISDSVSANTDHNSNFEPVEQQNDSDEKIDQSNITKPASSNKLENDSSAECSLDSCENYINPVKNKHKENVVSTTDELKGGYIPLIDKDKILGNLVNDKDTEELTTSNTMKYLDSIIDLQVSKSAIDNNNVKEIHSKSDHQKNTDSVINTPQNQHIEKTVNVVKDSDNLLPEQNFNLVSRVQDNSNTEELKTSNTMQDLNNKTEPQVYNSSIDDNNVKEIHSKSDYQKNTDSIINTPQNQHIVKTINVIKDLDNLLPEQNINTAPHIQDNNNTEELMTSNTLQDLDNKIEPQVSNSSIDDNNVKEIHSENDQQKNIDSGINTIQDQRIEKTVNIVKETDNSLSEQNFNTAPDILEGNNNDIDKLRTSSIMKDLDGKIEPQVPNGSIDNNNIRKKRSDSDFQTNIDSVINTPQNQHIDKTVNVIKDTANSLLEQNINTVPLPDSIKIPGLQDSNISKEITNESLKYNGSLDNNTQENSLSDTDNSIQVSSYTKEEIKGTINESYRVSDNDLSKNINDDNLVDYNNASATDKTKKQPDIYHNITVESESQNISEDFNDKSTTSNSDQMDSETLSSSTPNLINPSQIIPPTDHQNSIDLCALEGGCSHLKDNPQKYDIEKSKPENKISHETVYKDVEPNIQLKENDPISLVASFGHPDTCSGVHCLKFNRNVEKVVKIPPINHIKNQADPDETSHSANIDINMENKNIMNKVTEQSHVEMSYLDHFQNWISSPTTNSINFPWNLFGDYSNEYNEVIHDQTIENQNMFQNISHSEIYFIIVAVITLLFSLAYYKHQKGTSENNLLTLLATKDQSLLIVEKELSILKELSTGSMISTTATNSEVETLNEHLTKSEDIISSQSIRIEKLEQEVEELTESGMEMHALLSSALESSSKSTEKINSFKSKLVDAENLIATLTQKNFDKTAELEKKNDTIKSIQITVDELTIKNMNLVEDNTKLSLQLEQNITKNMLKESKLLGEINNLQYDLDKQTNSLVAAENEVLLSKDALQEMSSQKFNPADAKKFLSSVKLSAELKSAKQICEGYKQKLNESLKSNRQHLDNIDVLKSDITNLEDKLEKLERKKEESINKLNILTNFFKDQEKDYLKQINEKAELCVNKEGESSSLQERINFQNQEIANYKSEIQSLKKEITDQEASFKIQISAADKKASDYWISFRQAERKLKEMELETAQLRSKLTMADNKPENGAKSIGSSKDFEDELLDIPLPTVSPDFTLLSLLDFEPPPPILTNQRLPPLGALGQAPSPPLRVSRRHNRSLSPGSPPPSQRSSVFRPLPQRYNYMDRQNSLGHSVESLEK